MLLTRRMKTEGRPAATHSESVETALESRLSTGFRLYHMSDYIDLDGDAVRLDVSATSVVATSNVFEPLDPNDQPDSDAADAILALSDDGIEDVQPASHLPHCTCGEDAPVAGIISGVHECPAASDASGHTHRPQVPQAAQCSQQTRSDRQERRARFLLHTS